MPLLGFHLRSSAIGSQTSLSGDSGLKTTAPGPFLFTLALELRRPSLLFSHSCPENGLRKQRLFAAER